MYSFDYYTPEKQYPANKARNLSLRLDVKFSGYHLFYIWINVEALNNFTGHHGQTPGYPSGLQIFHMMCPHKGDRKPSKTDQEVLLDAIKENPRSFYAALYKANKDSANDKTKEPLVLFKDNLPDSKWDVVNATMETAQIAILGVVAVLKAREKEQNGKSSEDVKPLGQWPEPGPIEITPCYALIISADPYANPLLDPTDITPILMQPGMTAVQHT